MEDQYEKGSYDTDSGMFEYVTKDAKLSPAGTTVLVVFLVAIVFIAISSTIMFRAIENAGKKMLEVHKAAAKKLARDMAQGNVGSMRISTSDDVEPASESMDVAASDIIMAIQESELVNQLNVVRTDRPPRLSRPASLPHSASYTSEPSRSLRSSQECRLCHRSPSRPARVPHRAGRGGRSKCDWPREAQRAVNLLLGQLPIGFRRLVGRGWFALIRGE